MTTPTLPFIALKNLTVNGVPAFTKGDGIHEDNAGLEHWELGVDYAEAGSEAAEEAVTGPQRPANSATKSAWVDYAAALHEAGDPLGLTAAEADARTRDQIIEHIDGQAG